MRLSGITPESLVDCPGLRYVIFTQGCPHRCPNCHNPTSWDTDAGKEFTVKEIIRMLKKQNKTKNPARSAVYNAKHRTAKIQGVTFSGGEPFLQAEELSQIADAAHKLELDVVTYTGFTYEELIESANNDININALLSATDLLIDGRYIHEMRTANLPFRGSSNQRIINIPETQKKGRIVLN